MQNDFFNGGMEIEGAKEIIPLINRLRTNKMFDKIYLCRDWHPKEHISFVSNHPGMKPFETKTI